MAIARLFTAALVLALFSAPSFAKTLYVDGESGSDAVSYADNSASAPWRTIGRAAWGSTNRGSPNASQAARAGDTVIVRAGTYTTTGTDVRYDPAYNPVNSGTATAPIVFEAEGTVVLTQTGRGPVIGANGNYGARNYIVWRGFTINEINAPSRPDTGPVVLWSTTGSRIENCTINGFDNGLNGDNHNGIRLENTTDVVIRNNRIYNVLNFGQVHHNGAGIMAYFSRGAIIEHNEIYDSGAGIFVKGGDNRDFTIRYNLVRNNGKGILTMYTHAQGEHRIYQNIAINNNMGISVELNSKNVWVVNNTLYNNRDGLRFGWCGNTLSNIRIANNIVANNASQAVNGGECETIGPFSIDRNLYHSNPGGWSIAGQGHSTLTAWRNATGGREANSASANPAFVNAAAGNLRLQQNSPGASLGVDTLDLNRNGSTTDTIPAGAYVSGNETIGLTDEMLAAAPQPPHGVTVD